MFPATPQRTAERLLVAPTPSTAEVIVWVVEIGAAKTNALTYSRLDVVTSAANACLELDQDLVGELVALGLQLLDLLGDRLPVGWFGGDQRGELVGRVGDDLGGLDEQWVAATNCSASGNLPGRPGGVGQLVSAMAASGSVTWKVKLSSR
jgi:hypothetical protein